MTVYCTVDDCIDTAFVTEQRHVDEGNMYVDVVLSERGIKAADITGTPALLTAIAANYAKRLAALEGAIGENSPLIDKAKQLKTTLEMLEKGVTKAAFDIVSESGYGAIAIGRA